MSVARVSPAVQAPAVVARRNLNCAVSSDASSYSERFSRIEHDRVRGRVSGGAMLLLVGLSIIAWLAQPATSAPPFDVRAAARRIDPNTATREELILLPGIGPKMADAIVHFRESTLRSPAFVDAEDLDAVPRIGPKTLNRLRPFLRFGVEPKKTGLHSKRDLPPPMRMGAESTADVIGAFPRSSDE